MPLANRVKSASVNGRPATIGGVHGDTVIVQTANAKHFEVVGLYDS
jgi:hypothetical protein